MLIEKQINQNNININNCSLKEKSVMLGNTPGKTYIWFNNGEYVGQFTTFNWWDGINLENLEISPKYRGQGLSYQILDFAVKEKGVKNLAVKKDNYIAKHTYKKYGFKVTESDDEYDYMSI